MFEGDIKNIAVLTPRRVGKTALLMFAARTQAKRYPGSSIAYIVPSSKQHAKRLFWNPLWQMNQQLKLGMDFKVAEHCVVTKEGTRIYVFGAKNKESPRLLRGDAWSLAILDECKDFGPHFEELIVEALLPGLEDYDGTLMLAGTPGEVLSGLFYNITSPDVVPDGWHVEKWKKDVNTFLEPHKRDLEQIERREYWPFGLTRESPKFRREQLAEWCTDDSERAYMYREDRNGWDVPHEGTDLRESLPVGHEWLYCLGLDLGEKDANAFIVFAFSLSCRECYVVYEYARPRMSIDEIAAETRNICTIFGDMATMVADTGGYGRGIVTDLQQRHNLAYEAADKTGNKLGNIAQMNSDFLCGFIKAPKAGKLAKEWLRLTRRIRNTDGKTLISHSDLGDAALYAWKASKHYASFEKPRTLVPGSEEYYLDQERQAVEQAVRKRNRGAGQWWGSPLSDAYL